MIIKYGIATPAGRQATAAVLSAQSTLTLHLAILKSGQNLKGGKKGAFPTSESFDVSEFPQVAHKYLFHNLRKKEYLERIRVTLGIHMSTLCGSKS